MSQHDLAILRSTFDRIRIGVARHSDDAVAWGTAWLDVMTRENIHAAVSAGVAVGRDFDSSKEEKFEAGELTRWIRKGWQYATQVAEANRDLADLYPQSLAVARLEGRSGPPLGGSDHATQTMIDLDHAMMRNRRDGVNTEQIRKRTHALLRSRFPELESR